MMPLRARIDTVVARYLEAVDQEAPGVVEGLYLTGSIALGEFRPNTSDIDFLAIAQRQLDPDTVAALGRTHARLRSRCPKPCFDGRYLTWDQLESDPSQAAPGPYSLEGLFHVTGRQGCDPVAWQTLARHGVRCRGPEPGRLTIWTEPAALASWTLGNFDSYWQPLLRRARRPPDPWSLTAFTSYGAAWLVLGVCRLHYTLATGRIASREAAGEYGLETFAPQWHLPLKEALRIRRSDRSRADAASALAELIHDFATRPAPDGGSLYRTPLARRNDALAFAEMVVGDASAQFGAAGPRTFS